MLLVHCSRAVAIERDSRLAFAGLIAERLATHRAAGFLVRKGISAPKMAAVRHAAA